MRVVTSPLATRSSYERIPENDDNDLEGSTTLMERLKSHKLLCFVIVLLLVSFVLVIRQNGALSLLFIGGNSESICRILDDSMSIKVVDTSLSKPSKHWSEQFYEKGISTASATTEAEIKVDFSLFGDGNDERPPILGFGGAFTEAAALNYMSLTEEGKKALLELLFGRSGLGYSLGRVHMNSCDFSVKSYSFDEYDMDLLLEEFDDTVSHDVKSGMIEMMLEGNQYYKSSWEGDGLKVIVSPWSPPAWMKAPTDSDPPNSTHAEGMEGSHLPNCLREGTGETSRFAKAWALYFSKFITSYENLGIPIWGVTVQNEPEFPAPWEACSYSPKEEGEFIGYHLGPMLNETHPDVKLLAFDHNKDHAVDWMTFLLQPNHPAAAYIDGTAIHWYAGGMDRLLDGAVGSPNMHRLAALAKQQKQHYILGSEACHCPSTGYAGGDINVAWERAERYAHTVLADLAAGSNGWIEWNLILDSIGGPNHLGNVCDTTLLAVPHRAANADVPPQLDFEHAGYPFGKPVGDKKTKEELDALGSPAEFLDVGIAVQPMYYYMGHISRHVRPGSRSVQATLKGTPFLTSKQNGGPNNLARNGIELTTWPCEGSTRQFFYKKKSRIQVYGHDWLWKPTTSCVSNHVDKSLGGLTLVDCDSRDSGSFSFTMLRNGMSKIRLITNDDPNNNNCLVIQPLHNHGGAYSSTGGASVIIGDCDSPSALWDFNHNVLKSFFFHQEVCLTTGWPFLQVGAFLNNHSKTVVILNEASDPASYVLKNDNGSIMSFSIGARSIQTVLISTT